MNCRIKCRRQRLKFHLSHNPFNLLDNSSKKYNNISYLVQKKNGLSLPTTIPLIIDPILRQIQTKLNIRTICQSFNLTPAFYHDSNWKYRNGEFWRENFIGLQGIQCRPLSRTIYSCVTFSSFYMLEIHGKFRLTDIKCKELTRDKYYYAKFNKSKINIIKFLSNFKLN